ncbi:hypothetical protein EVAR_56020_1 [Eumeta japonica]|uniref:Uncharacterized protein n=1 Tax=Eumeta variegata TaxID=151549 RepID=A0A4C1YJ43_EUMVA|nr:hypothetical protein EVAR_56020_1 [Eumeta japonica]
MHMDEDGRLKNEERPPASTGGRLRVQPVPRLLPPRQLPPHNPVPPPAIGRMRDDARAAGGPAWAPNRHDKGQRKKRLKTRLADTYCPGCRPTRDSLISGRRRAC